VYDLHARPDLVVASPHPWPTATLLIAPSVPAVFFTFLATLFLIGVAVRSVFFVRRRHEQMRAMAMSLGLRPWPDNSLPRRLSLQGTPFQHWSKLSNIYEGSLNGTQTIILDFFYREPRNVFSRTIIAVNSNMRVQKPYDLESRQIGPWQLIFAPVQFFRTANLMDVDQVEILLKAITRKCE
jgi:hypothetical protein